MNVTFDSIEIVNSTYIPRYIKHESAPTRLISFMPLAREDGSVFISEKYAEKKIIVAGKLTGADRDSLDSAIDDFKELFSRKEKNLDISWAGSTRRYVATCADHDFDRDHMHDFFVPWVAEFVVAEGVGKDTSQTAALDGVSADPTYSGSVTFDGSAEPKPTITLGFGSGWSDAYGIKFENTDTNEECIINYDTGFSDGDELEIDCEEKTVKLNDTEIEFYRVFPSFDIGSNNIEITAGDIIDQEFTTIGGYGISIGEGESSASAQSFTVPHSDDTYQGISLYIKKSGTGSGDIVVEIQTDSNGEPSGTAVSNGTFNISIGDVDTDWSWVTVNSTNKFSLSANTRYWIVVWSSSGGGYNYWEYSTEAEATYGRGLYAKATAGSWTTYSDRDAPFKLLYGGKADSPGGTLTLDIDYYKTWL